MERTMHSLLNESAISSALTSKYDLEIAPFFVDCQYSLHHSQEGMRAVHHYEGNYAEVWLAYSIFKTLAGTDVIKTVEWIATKDSAPFIQTDEGILFVTSWDTDYGSTAKALLKEQAIFLAKWHYLCREIIKSQSFVDSLEIPLSLSEQLRAIVRQAQKFNAKKSTALTELVASFATLVERFAPVANVQQAITVTLPAASDSNFVRYNGQTVFLPVGQRFVWGWQILDIARLIRRFPEQSAECYREVLQAYSKLNPLQPEELRWLSVAVLIPSHYLRDFAYLCEQSNNVIKSIKSNQAVYHKLCLAISWMLEQELAELEIDCFQGGKELITENINKEIEDSSDDMLVETEKLEDRKSPPALTAENEVVDKQEEATEVEVVDKQEETTESEVASKQEDVTKCEEEEKVENEVTICREETEESTQAEMVGEQTITEDIMVAAEGKEETAEKSKEVTQEQLTKVDNVELQASAEEVKADNTPGENEVDEREQYYRAKYKALITWSAFPKPINSKE